MPMLFYLINVLFFSDFFTHEIKLWSSIGIWFSCCIMVSYIYIYDIFSIFRINNMNFFVNSPVSIFKISIFLSSFTSLIFDKGNTQLKDIVDILIHDAQGVSLFGKRVLKKEKINEIN